MSKTVLTNENISKIIELYKTIKSTHKLSTMFNVGHKKISKILIENNVQINKKGGQEKNTDSKLIEKSKTSRYSSEKKLVAVCKKTNKEFDDINNLSGSLTRHILRIYNNISIPLNNYQRKRYEYENGKKWFEEYFDIIEKNIVQTRKCGLCDWKTEDLENKTGCFENHIVNTHNITLNDYLIEFPKEIKYHKSFIKNNDRNNLFLESNNYVVCNICGEKMKVISNTHLKNKHEMSSGKYKLLFPNQKLASKSSASLFSDNTTISNVNMTPTWTSKDEIEIKEFIENLGFFVEKAKNRKMLNGKEIDLVIPEAKLCIEYNGLYYHTEKMGKNSTYHLNKTMECDKMGYKLIHIFEDEWILNKELVKNKIKHLLKVNDGIRIGARKINIKQIESDEKGGFLNENHIQGNDSSKIYYGGYYNNVLIGVMTFNGNRNMTKSIENQVELTRFSVKTGYIVPGLASKFIKRFINEYSPKSIISFADRRWTPNADNNLYTKMGFTLVKIDKPNYYYYNPKVNRYKRFHKFGFGKTTLRKKYPYLDFRKSEKELNAELGFERIWNCGLFKYELKV